MPEAILSLLNIVTHFNIITTYAVGLINIPFHMLQIGKQRHAGVGCLVRIPQLVRAEQTGSPHLSRSLPCIGQFRHLQSSSWCLSRGRWGLRDSEGGWQERGTRTENMTETVAHLPPLIPCKPSPEPDSTQCPEQKTNQRAGSKSEG